MSEPICTDVTATVSVAGKIEIVKYECYEDYFFSWGRTYSIPGDWDEEDVQKFQSEKTAEFQALLDKEFATPTVDLLMEKRDALS